jgi:hypothetical protein
VSGRVSVGSSRGLSQAGQPQGRYAFGSLAAHDVTMALTRARTTPSINVPCKVSFSPTLKL